MVQGLDVCIEEFKHMNREDKEIIMFKNMLCAFDYFEHFQEPLKEVDKVIIKLKPDYIWESSDFSHAFIGHFEDYKLEGVWINHKKVKKFFSSHLEVMGYKLHPISKTTVCWNGEPRIWRKVK